jgi:hypothetical protein
MKRILIIPIILSLSMDPFALNAMQQESVATPTDYKLEQVYDFENAPFYQQLQITVSLSDTNQTATDIVRQFVTHKGTCIPHTARKDVATVSLDSGYSAVVTYKHLVNDDVKLLYDVKQVTQASLVAYYVPWLASWASGTQVAKDSIKTKVNEEYAVPILDCSIFNGTKVASTLKIKTVIFKHFIPEKKNLARDRNRSDVLTSNTER